ncbi:MAG: hypothetical protein WEA82_06990 [Idiomarina sp.]
MESLHYHFNAFRECAGKRELKLSWLRQRAQQLQCSYVGIFKTATTNWLCFADTPGVDGAALVRSKFTGHNLLYVSRYQRDYVCVHWHGDKLCCAQTMVLASLQQYLTSTFAATDDTLEVALALPQSDAARAQLAAYFKATQLSQHDQPLAASGDKYCLVPLARLRRVLQPYRYVIWAITLVLVVAISVGLMWLQQPAPVTPVAPADPHQLRLQQATSRGVAVANTLSLVPVLQHLQRLSGWNLQQLVVAETKPDVAFLQMRTSYGDVTSLRKQLTGLSLQWEFSQHGVVLQWPLSADSAAVAAMPEFGTFAIQVQWLLDALARYLPGIQLQLGARQTERYGLSSRQFQLKLQQLYSEDLETLLNILQLLPVRLLNLELTSQRFQVSGEMNLIMYAKENAHD